MKLYSFLLIIFVSYSISAQDLQTFFSKANTFLMTHVKDGKVAYGTIYEDQKELNEILKISKGISVQKSDGKDYQAFWINAYNLAVIKGVIDNYPTKSPLDDKGFFDKTTYDLGGEKITLNDIENTVLRGNFNDARFHFVLVCGAVGCPPLISEAYMPNTLDAQLEEQTKIALNGNFIKVNSKKRKVLGSEILKWYKEDFTRNGTTEINFINGYRTEKIPDNYKLSYFPYNWTLNKQ